MALSPHAAGDGLGQLSAFGLHVSSLRPGMLLSNVYIEANSERINSRLVLLSFSPPQHVACLNFLFLPVNYVLLYHCVIIIITVCICMKCRFPPDRRRSPSLLTAHQVTTSASKLSGPAAFDSCGFVSAAHLTLYAGERSVPAAKHAL